MTTFEKLASIAARHAPAQRPALVARKDDEATIYIYDAITPPDWGGISARDFTAALDEAKGAKTLHVRINSPGGAVYDAKAIYQALREFTGRKVVHVDGLAASAASFIAMAGDRIVTAPEATWFIHGAQGMTMGDAAAHRDTADLLDMESDNIRAIYAKRTGQKPEDLKAWMDAETFMTAAEAKARGFTDEIDGEEDEGQRATAAAAPRVVALANETQRRLADPENRRRIAALRERGNAMARRQQERSRASAASRTGQPGTP